MWCRARASCWHDAFTCCVDVVDTDMQDAHGVDDADAVNWTVPLASESLDDSTGDMREQGDDTPRNAAFMDEGTDMEREKAGVDPCSRRLRGLEIHSDHVTGLSVVACVRTMWAEHSSNRHKCCRGHLS